MIIESEDYRAVVDGLGRILSLCDRETGYEYVTGALNELCMYRDINVDYDAWEIGRMYEAVPVKLKGEGKLYLRCEPDGVHMDIHREEAYFTWQQEIIFLEGSRRIEFKTKVDWRERHKLLKVVFPTTVYTKEVMEEIQFGYLKRPTHRSRRYEKDRYETCHHRYAALSDGKNGFAVLNNCKYGISAKDSTLALTLLRAPVKPDEEADQGQHEFTYALYLFAGPFTESDVVREAYELNLPVQIADGVSKSNETTSYFSIDQKNIILETLKPAMEEKNGAVARLYESMGSAVECNLFVPPSVREVWLCNMLEERQERVLLMGRRVQLKFHSFEIKTLLLVV